MSRPLKGLYDISLSKLLQLGDLALGLDLERTGTEGCLNNSRGCY